MSWSYGVNEEGKPIGYGVADVCNQEECKKDIDRGLAYKCGGTFSLHNDYGCTGYFCDEHLYFGKHDQLCQKCYTADGT
jgi:hypothetical protein